MLKITHADVTRQNVWDAFRRCHDVCLRERYIMPSCCCSMAIPALTSPSGYTTMKTPFVSGYMRSMSRDSRDCKAPRFPVGPRDCTRPIARLSRRGCVKVHVRWATI